MPLSGTAQRAGGRTNDLVQVVAEALGGGRYGLAVSGGGDSMALMELAAAAGVAAEIATVDHGLRSEAAAEARMVAARAGALGLRHETLHWNGKAVEGNVPDAARRARRRLLAGWAAARGLSGVVLAHTADDVAETFLMRLARGAGVDGLSKMAGDFEVVGVQFLRPLLEVRRGELRAWLEARGLGWAEDPTNADPHYDRTRARAALGALTPLGLSVERIAEVAGHMAAAREALEAATDALLRRIAVVEGGGLALRLDREALFAAPSEVSRRTVVAVILWLAPRDYAPRGGQVRKLLARLQAGDDAQLQGVRFFTWKGGLWACREARAVAAENVAAGAVFDGRWRLEGAAGADCDIHALGAEGLRQCPGWRAAGLPRAALLAAPALWRDGDLVAAPQAGRAAGFRALCLSPAHPRVRRTLSH